MILTLTLAAASPSSPRFWTVPIVLDSDKPLAAWQIEVISSAQVVGVEGGEAPFDGPAYYDPEALTRGRLVLADFSTRGALPPGPHVVATLHVRETGEAQYRVVVTAAADPDGVRIQARARMEMRP